MGAVWSVGRGGGVFLRHPVVYRHPVMQRSEQPRLLILRLLLRLFHTADRQLWMLDTLPTTPIVAQILSQPFTRRRDCATLQTMNWTSLKKGPASLHVAYAGTFTNNLHGHETRIRTQPCVEISFDLNPNLRTRNKSANSYVDARELADGEIASLKEVQIVDDSIVELLQDVIGSIPNVSNNWTLSIELEGTHSFAVRPAFQLGSIFLSVASDK